MKHCIDPKVDIVFKALLGSDQNQNLLVHFLNANLQSDLETPVVAVEITNPYNEHETFDDKLSIVDVKARDKTGQLFQVEIQLLSYPSLPSRMVYTWADIYCKQLRGGQDYKLLRPTYAIWLMDENLLKDDDFLHTFKFRDAKGRSLLAHSGIWVLELRKFHKSQIENEQQRWLQFLKEGEQMSNVNSLPDWMNTPEMRQAMSTLVDFSEKEKNYHAYQARQNFLRQQRTIQKEMEEYRSEKEAALQEKQAALQEKQAALQEKQAALKREQAALQDKQAALAEIDRLKALLEQNQNK